MIPYIPVRYQLEKAAGAAQDEQEQLRMSSSRGCLRLFRSSIQALLGNGSCSSHLQLFSNGSGKTLGTLLELNKPTQVSLALFPPGEFVIKSEKAEKFCVVLFSALKPFISETFPPSSLRVESPRIPYKYPNSEKV